ncbi:MAG: AP2/ERF family transcription factor, partial [Bacillota bacterium]
IKLSIEDLSKIQEQYWYFNKGNTDFGSGIKTYDTDYYKDREVFISEVLFPEKKENEKINHKNRNRHDFRRKNIIFDNAVNYRKAFKHKKSESTIPGVFFIKRNYKKNGKTYYYKGWKACYRKDGKNKSCSFSIKKYGDEEAKEMAIQKRKEWEEEFEEKEK